MPCTPHLHSRLQLHPCAAGPICDSILASTLELSAFSQVFSGYLEERNLARWQAVPKVGQKPCFWKRLEMSCYCSCLFMIRNHYCIVRQKGKKNSKDQDSRW